MSEILI